MTGIPGYVAPEPGYTMPAPGFTSLSGLRGPESCGGRGRGSGRSSNKSLTCSEIQDALRGPSSPTTVGVSPHRLQANDLVRGMTNTLGSLRSRPMPTPAVIPRSPFVPRTAMPPYSHVDNSTRAELDRLGLKALRAMIDFEPYGSSDLGGDPSDDKPPSMTSASPSEDNDPEDPETRTARRGRKSGRPSAMRDAGLRCLRLSPPPRSW